MDSREGKKRGGGVDATAYNRVYLALRLCHFCQIPFGETSDTPEMLTKIPDEICKIGKYDLVFIAEIKPQIYLNL